MGAEVQCGNYLPGYYRMMDLNDDARSIVRSHFFEDRVMIRGQFYNGFVRQNSDGYPEYDTELLKQTMLDHEAVFRKQVTELHRLYQVQKDLMDGMKRKETSKYPLPAEIMHESQCLFQIRPDNSLRTWQMPMPSVVSSSCSRQSGSDTDNMQSSPTLLKENGSMRKYYEPPDLERNKCSKRTFDLQLPAYEYIDIEDNEPSTEEVKVLQASSRSLFGDNYGFNKNSDILAESEVKLTLGTGCNTSVSSDHCKQQTDHPRSVHGYKISESSINHKGSSSQMAATSFRVPGVFVDDIRTRRLSFQPNASSSGPQKDHIEECNSGGSHRQFWNHLDSECEGSRVVWCSSNLGSGEYKSIGAPSPLGYRNVEGQFEKPCRLPASHLPDEQKQKDLWFKDHGDGHMELSKMNLPDLNQTNAVTATSLSSTFSAPSQLDMANTAYAEIPWRTSMNTRARLPFGVQSQEVPQGKNYPNKASFPPFQGTELSEEKWYSNGSLRSSQRVDCEVPYHNGFALSEPAANGSYPSSSLCFDKLDLNNGDCSSYGYSKGGSKKLLKALDHHDIQANKSVSLTPALPNGVGDGGECQIHEDLPFNKEGKHGNHLEDQCKHETVAKADSKSACPNNGQGLSRLQFISGIDLEVPLEVESEMPTSCEKRPVDAGSVTQSKGSPAIVHDFMLFPANKHKSAFIPEAGKAHNSSSSKLKFLKEPFSIDFSSVFTSTKGCQRFGGSKNHALLGEFQGSTRITSQGFGKQISVDRAHGSHTHKDIHDNSTGLCCQSVFPECSLHESVHSSKMKHKCITKGAAPSSEGRACTGNGKIVKPIDEERFGGREFDLNLDDSHQIVLGLPCDSMVTQTPLLSATLLERFSCTEEPIKTDRLTVNEICFSTGDNSNSSIALDRLAAEMLIRISSLGSESSCAVASNQLELPLGDSLKWFADVVCSDDGQRDSTILVSKGNNENCPEPFEEEDFFESMTLMLEDTKIDEYYCYKPKPQQEEKMAAEIDASPSQKQSTRRTQRRVRRQKDFQTDILPSLVSLSRNEVNEDMQTMGTLMRASGCFWQTRSARRNGCRNDRNSLKRGRRSRYSATAMEADDAVLAILQSTCDPDVDKAIKLQAFSWGKITRRRRKQRCPATIPASCTTEKS